MKKNISQYIYCALQYAAISLFSGFFLYAIVMLFLGDVYYIRARAVMRTSGGFERAYEYLDHARYYMPISSEYYFEHYQLLHKRLIQHTQHDGMKLFFIYQQIRFLQEAIRLEPLKPVYHMLYALALKRLPEQKTPMIKKIIAVELQKAYALKPYSALYKKIWTEEKMS